jgi:hypothetical protein
VQNQQDLGMEQSDGYTVHLCLLCLPASGHLTATQTLAAPGGDHIGPAQRAANALAGRLFRRTCSTRGTVDPSSIGGLGWPLTRSISSMAN